MPKKVKFGSRGAANTVREDPQLKPFLAESDDRRQQTVKLKENIPRQALDDASGRAADSRKKEAEKAGQVELSRREREEIDFSRDGVNVPKVRSIKGIATNEGVSDYLSFADFELSVDENRELLRNAAQEEKGRRGLGAAADSAAQTDKRLANAFNRQREEEADRAKDFGLVERDSDAQSFLRDRFDRTDFDIALSQRDGKFTGRGTDFDRLQRRHEDRSQRAQRMDENRQATITTDPIKWTNNPAQFDYPGVDTPNMGNSDGLFNSGEFESVDNIFSSGESESLFEDDNIF